MSAAVARWAPFALFVVVFLVALPTTSTGFPTADGVSYLSIAEHWANGRSDLAVNGFWSPLLSFLLVPAALVGAPMFLSGQILMGLIGLFALAMVKRLMRVLNYDTLVDDLLVIGAVPLVVYASISLLTPDLLMAALLLGYLSTMIDRRPMSPVRRGVIAGCWAGAAFLAKAYALPFVVAHLVLTVLVRLVRRSDLGQRRTVALVAMGVTALWVLPWATVLSVDAGRPIVTTVGDYHVDVTSRGSSGNAFVWAGILPPTHEFAVSAWEDPSRLPRSVDEAFVDLATDDDPEPTSSGAGGGAVADEAAVAVETGPTVVERIENRARRTLGSLRVVTVAGGLMGLTGVVGTLAMLWWLVSRRPRRPVRQAAPDPFVDVVIAVTVYIGGLSLLVVETRYLWAPLLLTVPCAAWGLRRLRARLPRIPLRAVAAVVALGSVAGPAIGISRVLDKASRQDELRVALAPVLESGDRVVTSRSALSTIPGICYLESCTYWGATQAETRNELEERLDRFGVDVYIRFGDDEPAGGGEVARIERTGSDLVVSRRSSGD